MDAKAFQKLHWSHSRVEHQASKREGPHWQHEHLFHNHLHSVVAPFIFDVSWGTSLIDPLSATHWKAGYPNSVPFTCSWNAPALVARAWFYNNLLLCREAEQLKHPRKNRKWSKMWYCPGWCRMRTKRWKVCWVVPVNGQSTAEVHLVLGSRVLRR